MNKMEEEYNWNLILKVSIPVSLAVGYVFYTNASDFWKWISLVCGSAIAAMIVYTINKRKSNVFTAAAVVFLAALVIRFIKSLI